MRACLRRVRAQPRPALRSYSAAATAAASSPVRVVREGAVAVLHMNDTASPVNVGNEGFMQAMHEAWQQVQADTSVEAVVLYSEKPGNFVAGADISMLGRCTTVDEASKLAQGGQSLLNEIAASRKPVVAAIHGACMGLGTELTLACHYRIATDAPKTVMALPEVQLGLLPGAGGTQRLPRLVGLPNALSMALTGANIKPSKAKKMGLVDEVVASLGPGVSTAEANTMRFLRSTAVERARDLAKQGGYKRSDAKWSLMQKVLTNTSFGRGIALSQAAAEVEKTTHGNYPAPTAILSCVREGLEKGLSAGFAKEAKEFGRLVMTPESQALRSIFFATTALKKNRFGSPTNACNEIGVVGAGLMGAGIADVSLNKAKLNVVLVDAFQAGLERGEHQITSNLDKSVKKKKLTSFERDTRLSNLTTSLNYGAFAKCDVVVEAVFEDLKVKHDVIRAIEKVVSPRCIIATNTSALPIKDVAAGSSRPQNVVGMHYFSPVEKMPLLEVITHDGTSKEAAAQAVHVGLKQGKTVIVVKDGPGFYTTRILMPYLAEAFALMEEGVEPGHLDRVMRQFGFPVGPVVLTDEVGIDVGYHIAKYLSSVFPTRMGSDMKALHELTAAGFKGRKSGRGFYIYDAPKPSLVDTIVNKVTGKTGKELNPGAIAIMKKHTREAKVLLTDEAIATRMVGRMANEAVECLKDGILANPTDGDIGAVFGLGFPAFLGGPFRWIDRIGAKTLTRELEGYASIYGPQFAPSSLLVEHARSNKKFHN